MSNNAVPSLLPCNIQIPVRDFHQIQQVLASMSKECNDNLKHFLQENKIDFEKTNDFYYLQNTCQKESYIPELNNKFILLSSVNNTVKIHKILCPISNSLKFDKSQDQTKLHDPETTGKPLYGLNSTIGLCVGFGILLLCLCLGSLHKSETPHLSSSNLGPVPLNHLQSVLEP